MRRVYVILFVAGIASATGCLFQQSKKPDFHQPKVMEFNPPPDEPRYNNPPEEKYRKPPVSKDAASQPGAMGGMGPMMPGGGMGGR
jgi:hypothetical protein